MNITKDYLDKNPQLYKHVLLPHRLTHWMWDFKDLAAQAGYPFFLWNDIVYHTSTGRSWTAEELDTVLENMK